MIPYASYDYAKYRMQADQAEAAARRFRRDVHSRVAATHATPVFDAVGHGLIAIGTRLVSDPPEHPPRRRAA